MSLLPELGILRTRPQGWGRQRVWKRRHAERRLKYYGYALKSSLRLHVLGPVILVLLLHAPDVGATKWAQCASPTVRRQRDCSPGRG